MADLRAPVAGTVVKLVSRDGEKVNKDDLVLIIESMKMELEIRAGASGIISYYVQEGQIIKDKEIIARISETSEEETIEQHRKAGDLIDWVAKMRCGESDGIRLSFFSDLGLSETEEKQLEAKSREFASKLCSEHKNDWDVWLEKVCGDFIFMSDYMKEQFSNEFKQKYSNEIPFHRDQGDLIDYLLNEIEKYDYSAGLLCDFDLLMKIDQPSLEDDYDNFSIEYNIIHPLSLDSEQIELYKFSKLDDDITETDFKNIDFLDTTGEHFKMLLDLYTSAPDSIEYKRFQKLRKRVGNAEAGRKLDLLLKLVPELEEQKKNGDPVWYAVEYIQKNKLDYMMFVTDWKLEGYLEEKDTSALKDGHSFDEKLFAQKYPIEAHIRNTLSESEIEEIYLIFDKIFNDNTECFRLNGFLERIDDFFNFPEWNYRNEGYKYLRSLAKSPKTSVKYERYLKVREKLGRNLCEQLDKKLRKHNIKDVVKYGIPSIGALLIIVGIVTCNVSSNKKAEQQRIENEAAGLGRYTNYELEQQEKARAKAEKKAAAAAENAKLQAELNQKQRQEQAVKNKEASIKKDQELIVSQMVKKMSVAEYLVQIPEPKLYVIAPMSYEIGSTDGDTSTFDGMIVKFETALDLETGVSFLDRSKISQIEKEHKFQLSDWSNDKKTTEMGKALNANVLLFFDKFTYNSKSKEYRFQAKLVDVNTMQTNTVIVSQKGDGLKTQLEYAGVINLKDFTQITTQKNPFADEFSSNVVKPVRTAQGTSIKFGNNQTACPVSSIQKLDISEFDEFMPDSQMLKLSSIYFDGFGSVEMNFGNEKAEGTYSFEPSKMFAEKASDGNFYTDGRIGTLSIHSDKISEKFDVFTKNNREFYLKVGSVELRGGFVHYYLQMVKQ